MPSGFQQDTNQVSPGLYRVVITMTNTTYYPTTGGTATDRGGITPNSSDSFSTANLPTTLARSTNRAQGNMRFRNIVNALSGLADCQILDIELGSEANGDAQATTLAFTAKYDRDAFIPLTGTYQGVTVVGNDISDSAMDTKEKVIKNEIAKAIRSATTATARVYDPTNGDSQISVSVTHTGATASQTLGTVAVTPIDGTELTTLDNAGTAE